jgi:ketosteroid isomerase-like protein
MLTASQKMVLAVLVLAQTLGATISSASDSAMLQIRRLEIELNDALMRGDAAAVDKLWADDFQFVFPSGTISNKTQRLAGLKPPGPNVPTLVSTVDDVQVRIYGSVAVAIVKTTWRGNIDGKAMADPYVATHVWSRAGRRWQLVSAQVAQIDPR